jgi:hypothetical protein
LACHLQIDADPDMAPDPAITLMRIRIFYLMRMLIRMQIQVTKMMRIDRSTKLFYDKAIFSGSPGSSGS